MRTEKSGDGLAAAKPEKESPPPTGWAVFTWFLEATLIDDCLLYANDSMPRTCPSLPAGVHPRTCTDPQTPWLFAHITHHKDRKYPQKHSANSRSETCTKPRKMCTTTVHKGQKFLHHGPGPVLQPCTAGHRDSRPPWQPAHRHGHHTNQAKHSAFICIKFQ